MARWRASPTGVGSAAQLWIALDEEFIAPLEGVLASTEIGGTRSLLGQLGSVDDTEEMEIGRIEGNEGGEANGSGLADTPPVLTAREVFLWWTYSPAWRSRKRVWYCVVHASATARDADWW
jgi:hypothetical protein